ncbi:hypothetical protein BGZ76_001151 [Entomortierella beljakovae]|nr:hypothetical protein BGZ76_001151 [Entomortierella beljakovae]
MTCTSYIQCTPQSLILQMILFSVCCITLTVAAAEATLTRDQIYTQGGFLKNWVAPLPSNSLESSGGSNSNNNGEKFLVQNWGTTFHSIQIGGNDISFTKDPFKKSGSSSSSSSSGISSNTSSTSDQVLQLNYPKGSYVPSVGTTTGGTHFYAKPFGDKNSFSKMMLSYDVGFPNGFNWVMGGKLPGVYGGTPYDGCSGGVQSTGTNCLTMRVMWRQNGIGEVYAYVPADPKSSFCKNSEVLCNDQYGKSIGRGQIYFQPGVWTRLDMVMELNSPAGNSNGTLQVYLNGNLAINLNNIPYRSTGMVGFQGLMFSSFFGGSDPTYATPVDTSVYFKNVQLSVGAPAELYEGTGGSGGIRSITVGSNIIGIIISIVASFIFAH